MSQTPAGTSAKNIIHFGQMVRNKDFTKFDYGCSSFSCKNKEVYGAKVPPSYNISDFTIPTALFYGEEDALADVQDVQYILENIPNLIFSSEIKHFAHLDFTWYVFVVMKLHPTSKMRGMI